MCVCVCVCVYVCECVCVCVCALFMVTRQVSYITDSMPKESVVLAYRSETLIIWKQITGYRGMLIDNMEARKTIVSSS